MRSRGFLFYFVIVALDGGLLAGLFFLDGLIRDAGHVRAVRAPRIQSRLRRPQPVWSPRLSPAQIQALEDRKTRYETIELMDLGPPTKVRDGVSEYARTLPLPSRNGTERVIEVLRELRKGESTKHEWVLRENGVEVDSGCSAFYFCGG